MIIVPSLFTIIFGLFFGLIGFKFLFKPDPTIRRLQDMKYKSSSTPSKQAIMMTRIFGVILMIIGLYFIGVGINILIS
ncbi:hypothetical protein KHQ88_02785 [Mycoplasmatota bacterium]|nr:hypothetical protein KHQ88_02785 [Mycoplasmatota bacterium]